MYINRFTPNGFGIKELADKETYEFLGDEAWKLFDIRLLITLDKIKRETGWTIIVNTWSFKTTKYGSFSQRGYRALHSTTGAKGGAHYLGMAIDFDAYDNGERISPDKVREYLLANIEKFCYIRCLETDINWVHLDVMGWEDHPKRSGVTDNKILLWSPKTGSKIIERSR